MTGGKIIIDGTVGDYTGSADFGERIGMNGGVVVIKKCWKLFRKFYEERCNYYRWTR